MALNAWLYFDEIKGSFNVLNCEYEFFTNTKNKDGKTEDYFPNTKTRGGYITITVLSPDEDNIDIYNWLILKKEQRGQFWFEIMVDGKKLARPVKFQKATCIELEEKFESQKDEQMTLKLKFCAQHIRFGEGADFFHINVKEDEKAGLKTKIEEKLKYES